MASWAELEIESPALANLGRMVLLKKGRGFLATSRADGSPRITAICPVVRGGRLLAGIIKATPKYGDLTRDARYALHAPLGEGDTEFWVTGRAQVLSDEEYAQLMATEPGWRQPIENAMFHLDIATAHGTIFHPGPNNMPVPDRRVFKAAA